MREWCESLCAGPRPVQHEPTEGIYLSPEQVAEIHQLLAEIKTSYREAQKHG